MGTKLKWLEEVETRETDRVCEFIMMLQNRITGHLWIVIRHQLNFENEQGTADPVGDPIHLPFATTLIGQRLLTA